MENELQLLIEKYVNNDCSKEELDRLFELAGDRLSDLSEALRLHWLSTGLGGTGDKGNREALYEAMMAGFGEASPAGDEQGGQQISQIGQIGGLRRLYRLAVGAAAIVITGGMIWLFGNRIAPKPLPAVVQAPAPHTEPGGNKAVLTLGDGSHIDLGSAANGEIARQGDAQVTKIGTSIDYTKGTPNTAVVYNTIATPRGGQYQLELADGTKVWLNAASSLKYPASFSGKDRTVELTGEAYFEVRPNAAKPFHVKVRNANVTDLATEFDVNAYGDEPVLRTTLIRGGVRVSALGSSLVLGPGEQGVLGAQGLTSNNSADIDEVTAWKEGNFVFDGTPLDEIMKQIARWYDLQVQFDGPYQSRTFSGIVSRQSPLPVVLDIMKRAGIKFQLDGGVIFVGQ